MRRATRDSIHLHFLIQLESAARTSTQQEIPSMAMKSYLQGLTAAVSSVWCFCLASEAACRDLLLTLVF